jgi:hypothetical protein
MIIFLVIAGYFPWRNIMSNASVTPGKKIQPAIPKSKVGKVLDREQMISEAAYFRAEQRGFKAGDPMFDWLDAEAEIDAVLKKH